MSSFIDFQNEIYLQGMGGSVPELPMTAAGLAERARELLDDRAYAYVAGGAAAERSAAAFTSEFDRYRIVPRMLRGTSGPGARDTSVEVLGTELAAPVLTSPVGVLELLHEKGEVEVA
ncbi:MAG: alpha-hydroxy-acid oxidizing protein, partial [Nocardia sp.]|nr:alpha-hydroxy-acid oxidizing protein [Nocardia sp.]